MDTDRLFWEPQPWGWKAESPMGDLNVYVDGGRLNLYADGGRFIFDGKFCLSLDHAKLCAENQLEDYLRNLKLEWQKYPFGWSAMFGWLRLNIYGDEGYCFFDGKYGLTLKEAKELAEILVEDLLETSLNKPEEPSPIYDGRDEVGLI